MRRAAIVQFFVETTDYVENSQFPRPDFHRQVQRHYGLQDTGIPSICPMNLVAPQ